MDTVPPASVPPFKPKFGPPVGSAINETSPVGVPAPEVGATFILKFTFAPWPMFTGVGLVEVIVIVDGVKFVVTVCQLFTRLVAFTDPSPVARSYPAVAVHPGVVVADGSTRTPIEVVGAVEQFGVAPFGGLPSSLAPIQATELLPCVMSLKVHAPFGAAVEAAHIAVPGVVFCATANLYST